MNKRNLSKLIKMMESPEMENHFDMSQWTTASQDEGFDPRACGSAACIGGTIGFLWVVENHISKEDSWEYVASDERAAGWLGMSLEDAYDLFYPKEPYIFIDKPKLAAKVLRHLASTGVVDWSIIDADLATSGV